MYGLSQASWRGANRKLTVVRRIKISSSRIEPSGSVRFEILASLVKFSAHRTEAWDRPYTSGGTETGYCSERAEGGKETVY